MFEHFCTSDVVRWVHGGGWAMVGDEYMKDVKSQGYTLAQDWVYTYAGYTLAQDWVYSCTPMLCEHPNRAFVCMGADLCRWVVVFSACAQGGVCVHRVCHYAHCVWNWSHAMHFLPMMKSHGLIPKTREELSPDFHHIKPSSLTPLCSHTLRRSEK